MKITYKDLPKSIKNKLCYLSNRDNKDYKSQESIDTMLENGTLALSNDKWKYAGPRKKHKARNNIKQTTAKLLQSVRSYEKEEVDEQSSSTSEYRIKDITMDYFLKNYNPYITHRFANSLQHFRYSPDNHEGS